jgi:hypothetical protein
MPIEKNQIICLVCNEPITKPHKCTHKPNKPKYVHKSFVKRLWEEVIERS